MLWKGWMLLKAAFAGWLEDRAASMGAAIAYYTVFSLAPMLLLVIAIAGLVFGQEAAQGALVDQLGGLMGRQGAAVLETMIANAGEPRSGIIATAIGFATLLLGATAVFGELQAALNVIWKAKPQAGPTALVRSRLLGLSLIMGIGFLLLVSLAVSAALAALGGYLSSLFAGLDILLQALNLLLSLTVVTLLFAMIYKVLPDVRIAWSDVWIGAAVTALLFTLGKYLISLYIGSSKVASGYGAAGALVIILLWVYYSAQIFLFGAEFTKAYARMRSTDGRRDPAG